ncbi:phytanoyl-CoA dioxygenase family protein [Phenylobacterium sp.]|uniref:phytanoyl-CoA dioxygenase family protein n=1 Tax=Phenylobacterium sp. TaxID=1871053 RepID=UPI0025D8C7A1|nr:phytanoyl-CoA dioxygenase family protein [Phenylobacterium sp.]MBX3483406.1 phytanoyl-CoA dioxygenase family protein [Phenylobacterium sp.]MCW5758541.1 phytanoyl-CoA dioxygenase family protein [Phenylobacterium sp.]
MEILDWKSMAGMAGTYRKARELGLEANIAELETFGFTVIEPEKTGASPGFAGRMLEKLMEAARQEDDQAVELNKHADAEKPAFGRQLFHLMERDPVFIEGVMNPAVRTMASYLMGMSYRLSGLVAFVKEGTARSTPMHCDSVGVPTPLPHYGSVCNVSWILTDYAAETGTLGMVPGSHRYCRHPTEMEQPKFIGGAMDDAMVTPVNARPGSLAVFTGNTWHCTYPKVTEEVRAHVAIAFCRNYVNPAENYADIADEVIAPYGPELARLVGKNAWQGYHAEGPKLENMALVRAAYQSQYG